MMMRFSGWLTAAMVICSGSCSAWATDRHVPGEYGTIQAAIDACVAGDLVIVADGTYTGVGNKNLDFGGRHITVRSASGDPNTCIIDCGGSGRGFYFHTNETAAAVVQGVTIRNGAVTSSSPGGARGGGIYCTKSSPTVTHCTVTGNRASWGGGLHLDWCSPMIVDNIITGNKSDSLGGGLYLVSSSPTIANNTIVDNAASTLGGGFYLARSIPTITNNLIMGNSAVSLGGGFYMSLSSPTVANSTIMDNSAGSGGGFYLDYSSPMIANDTITGNGASVGGALYLTNSSSPAIKNTIVAFNWSGIYGYGSVPTLRHNCVYGNVGYNYSGIADPTGTYGNISTDPAIAGLAYGGWHLRPDSPCVGAGDSAEVYGSLDLDGQARIQPVGGTLDIGADESDGTTPPAGPLVIVRVSLLGDDGQDGSSWALAKRTVQAGIQTAAAVGGEVWVQAGTYYERITLEKFVHVYGGFSGIETARDDRDWKVHVTTLDGQWLGAVVTATRPGYKVSTLDGFTVTHGSNSGLYVNLSSPIITNSIITQNKGGRGGGLRLYSCFPTLANTTITENSAYFEGGGLYLSSASPVITNTTIMGGHAASGGGIYLYGNSSPKITNTVVAFNSSGIHRYDSSSAPTLRYNCVYGNAMYNYRGIADPTGANGNISADPAIAGWEYGRWHLRPDSPCVGAGNNASVYGALDLDGQARIQPPGGTVDIGADESDGTTPAAVPFVIVRVSPLGDDDHDGSSWALAKRTVQAGIEAAAALGGEVWVQAGTYYERITLRPFAHVYGGFSGVETVREQRDWRAYVTILDAQQQGTVVTAANIGYAASTLDGFTITHGNIGGLYLGDAAPTVANNVVTDNSSIGRGGGLYLSGSSPTIANNTIAGNRAYTGGGLCLSDSSPMVVNNIIANNSASDQGGGLFLTFAVPTIANSAITGNTAGNGGGVYSESESSETLTNCILWGDAPEEIFVQSGSPVVTYCDVQGGWSGTGNINADPLFRSPGGPDNDPNTLADNDYRLLPGSPCIDAGNNSAVPADTFDLDGDGNTTEPLPFDLDGRPRFADDSGTADCPWAPGTCGTAPIVDMGTYEFQGSTHLTGDLSCDGVISFADINPFVIAISSQSSYEARYPNCRFLNADINGDGVVSFADINPFVRLLAGK